MKPALRLLFVLVTLAWTASQASAVPGRAEVKKIVGTATVTKGGGAATSLAQGMVLGTGDTISTSAGSTVDLNLGLNGDVLRVEPDSTLKLDQLDVTHISPPVVTTKLDLVKGGMAANVINKLSAASKYEIKTPSGVAGIRGTIVTAQSGTGINVIHGSVSWSPGQGMPTMTLYSGQGGNATATPAALAQAVMAQAAASISGSTASAMPTALANTVNTIAQASATAAAKAVTAAGGTPAQAAAAAAGVAQQVAAQISAALATRTEPAVASVIANLAKTTVAAAAVGTATGIVAGGGTVAAAQGAVAGAIANANTGATIVAPGDLVTLTTQVTTVANNAATATNTAMQRGQTGDAAAQSTVGTTALTTTQNVTTSADTGPANTTTVVVNPADVSVSSTTTTGSN